MMKDMQNNNLLPSSPTSWLLVLIFLFPLTLSHAATINITVNGSDQPVTTSVGQTVVFDVSVICGNVNNTLINVPGSEKVKDKSEVSWTIRNNSASPIRVTGFGVSWNCITDPGNICSTWKFEHLHLEKAIFKDLAATPSTNPFPVTDFDTDVGKKPNDNPYFDIPAGSDIKIKHMTFVDSTGKKTDPVPSGTQVQFTATWRDDNNNTYPQVFTVTWP